MTIKKGMKVKILAGKDKKKEGEVIEIDIKNNRAKVKGINIIKKHVKTTKEKKGGIIEKENFINISNLFAINSSPIHTIILPIIIYITSKTIQILLFLHYARHPRTMHLHERIHQEY